MRFSNNQYVIYKYDMCVFGTNFINVPYKGSITRYYTCM